MMYGSDDVPDPPDVNPLGGGVLVAVGVTVGIGVSVAVTVGVAVGSNCTCTCSVAVGVAVGTGVSVAVAVGIGVSVAVAVGIGFCGRSCGRWWCEGASRCGRFDRKRQVGWRAAAVVLNPDKDVSAGQR